MATLVEILKDAVLAMVFALLVYVKWKAIEREHSNEKLGNGGIQPLFRYPWDKKLK